MTDTLTRETREKILKTGRNAFKEAVKEAVKESYEEQASDQSRDRSGSGGGGFSGLVLLGGGVALGYLLSGREAEVKEALLSAARDAREGVDMPEETNVEIETEYESESMDEGSESTSSGRNKSVYLVLLVAGLAILGALAQKKRRGSSQMSDLDTDFSLDEEDLSEPDADSVTGVDTDESQGASTDEAED